MDTRRGGDRGAADHGARRRASHSRGPDPVRDGQRHPDGPGDARRLPRAVARVQGPPPVHGSQPAGDQPGHGAADQGSESRSVADPADRRRQHRLDVVADAGRDPARRHQLRADQGLAADHPRAGRRPRGEADPRDQPRERPPGARGDRGPGADPGDRPPLHRQRSRSATSPTSTAFSPGTATGSDTSSTPAAAATT